MNFEILKIFEKFKFSLKTYFLLKNDQKPFGAETAYRKLNFKISKKFLKIKF